jgi:hypothetical protein
MDQIGGYLISEKICGFPLWDKTGGFPSLVILGGVPLIGRTDGKSGDILLHLNQYFSLQK